MASVADEVAVSRTSQLGARRLPVLALMVTSGFAGLGYQIVWTKQSALWLGHDAPAMLAVIAAFFGGVGLGSLLSSRYIEASRQPQRWYAGCELVIGVWSLALALMLPRVTSILVQIVGLQPSAAWQWLVTFAGTFFLLLPATFAMGATVPSLERVLSGRATAGQRIGSLYAGNTFGAVAGVLACAFYLVPAIGLARTAIICAALNIACAAFAWTIKSSAAPELVSSNTSRHTWPLALTGLLGIGYEVVVIRVLSQVAENTVYTYAILLAVYLIGTALGAAFYAARRQSSDPAHDRSRFAWQLSMTASVSLLALAYANDIKRVLLSWFDPSMTTALLAEGALAVLAFLPPTLLMGALFSHLCATARAAGVSFGHSLAVNTLSAATAPVVFGVLLIPTLGPKLSLALLTLGYLMLVARSSWRRPSPWIATAGTLVLVLLLPPLASVSVPAGGRVVRYIDGASASVSVVEDAQGVARLHINNRQQEGSSATVFADARQAALPLLLHPQPARALILGVGTSVTAMAAARDSDLQVDAVELLPEVLAATPYFTRVFNRDKHPDNLQLIAADARRFVRTAPNRYDVIIADNFHPARSGSGSLYTIEHFGAVRSRLATYGLFCQWLPLHQMDLETLRTIAATFQRVFPHSYVILATNSLETPVVGLIARQGRWQWPALTRRLERDHSYESIGLEDEYAVLGSLIGGPASLARFTQGAAINTDDLPVVAYRAPRLTYASDSTPKQRLLSLVRLLDVRAHEVLDGTPTDNARRLESYWSARNDFLEVGAGVRPTADVRAMLDQVREPLINVLRESPDFGPAYDPLLAMAGALADVDVEEARVLLQELDSIQPSRAEARELIEQLPALFTQ